MNNGYPKSLIKFEIQKIRQKYNGIINTDLNNTTTNKKYVPTPYMKGTSERIQRIIKPYDLYLSNSASNTLRKQLIHLKDKIATNDKCGVVYKINCVDCQNHYIGETGRNLKTRIKEHKRDIQ